MPAKRWRPPRPPWRPGETRAKLQNRPQASQRAYENSRALHTFVSQLQVPTRQLPPRLTATCTAPPTRNSLLLFDKPPTRLTATCTALPVLRSLPRGSAIQCESCASPASSSQYSLLLLNFLTDAHSSGTQLRTTPPVLYNPRLTSTCRLPTPALPHSNLLPHSQPPSYSPINTARP